MLLREDVNYLLNRFGFDEKQVSEYDVSDNEVSYWFENLILGHSLEDGEYYLDRITPIPGTYLDPPDQDITRLISSPDLGEVLRKIGSELADQILTDLKYRKELEKELAEETNNARLD